MQIPDNSTKHVCTLKDLPLIEQHTMHVNWHCSNKSTITFDSVVAGMRHGMKIALVCVCVCVFCRYIKYVSSPLTNSEHTEYLIKHTGTTEHIIRLYRSLGGRKFMALHVCVP